MTGHAAQGKVGYLQLPATDLALSAVFYETVFGWQVDREHGGFEAPDVIGQLTTDLQPSAERGPVLWLSADDLGVALGRVHESGGRVLAPPALDGGQRWLTTVEDPGGNRIGLVVPVRGPTPQPLLAVRDVQASSRWYQELLGLTSDHGGPEYERLLAGRTLVLQLHQNRVEHHHGLMVDPESPVGNGVLVWFGDVPDLDAIVERAGRLGAPVVRELHRNPPKGQGNGPGHRELWVLDPDGYTVVVASPDGEAFE